MKPASWFWLSAIVVWMVVLFCVIGFAQMTPGLGPMVPETNGPGPASGNLIPNEGEMTPNPVSSSPPPTGCSGTGYDFTQACNSQYVVVL